MSPRRLGSFVLAIVSAGLVGVIWSFFVLVPYDSISDKTLFWTGFVIWAIPLVAACWLSVRKAVARKNQFFGNVTILEVFSQATVLALSSRWSVLDSVAIAGMPGFLAGVLIGMNSVLIPRILKGQIGPGY